MYSYSVFRDEVDMVYFQFQFKMHCDKRILKVLKLKFLIREYCLKLNSIENTLLKRINKTEKFH